MRKRTGQMNIKILLRHLKFLICTCFQCLHVDHSTERTSSHCCSSSHYAHIVREGIQVGDSEGSAVSDKLLTDGGPQRGDSDHVASDDSILVRQNWRLPGDLDAGSSQANGSGGCWRTTRHCMQKY